MRLADFWRLSPLADGEPKNWTGLALAAAPWALVAAFSLALLAR